MDIPQQKQLDSVAAKWLQHEIGCSAGLAIQWRRVERLKGLMIGVEIVFGIDAIRVVGRVRSGDGKAAMD